MNRPSVKSIVSRHIEAHGEPISQRLTVEGAAVTARVCKDRVRRDLAELIAEGYVEVEVDRSGTKWHRSIKPYRDN